jgi:Tol biopolymer transport system component
MPIETGARFGPYEIVELLGTGGMGEVYRARDPRLGRAVALKVLAPHVASDPDRVRRFQQEARATGILNHPNIVAVYDVGADETAPFVVYELLDGESLRDRLRRGRLPESEAVRSAVQMARGLAAAHDKGIVHRDLKPENVFVTTDGTVKLLDFGLAKLRDVALIGAGGDAPSTALQTDAAIVLGTVGYMAPEQVRAQAADHRSDIFSFGVVLYEMLTGERPFGRTSAVETMNAILADDPPALTDRVPALSASLARIVAHCLEKTPEARFQSARDLAFALEALSSGHVTAATESLRMNTARTGFRRRVALPLTAIASAAVAFAIAWALKPSPSASVGPMFTRVVRLAATDALESAPAISPDGKWVAYYSDAGGTTNIWVKFLGGGEPANVTASLKDLVISSRRDSGGLDISPDGTLITFDAGPPGAPAGQQSAYVIPAPLGGVPHRLLGAGRISARWSPDGRSVVFIEAGGVAGDSLYIADASGENPRVVLPRRGGFHAHWPAWSADGKHIYFNYTMVTDNAEPTEIYRVPAGGGPPERVIATTRRAVSPDLTRDGRALVYAANPSSFELSLWWKPLGGTSRQLTTGAGEYSHPRMSADGSRMVATLYQIRSALVSVPGAGGAAQPAALTAGDTGDNHPDVSPRGDSMVFTSTRGGSRSVWIARVHGSDARPLTSGAGFDERPAYSPDGSQVAFVSDRGGTRAVWVVSAEGGSPRRVVTAQVLDTITWSPDGRQIVFAAPAGERPGLWIVPVEGGEPKRMPTPAGATAPDWSPARNVVAYLQPFRDHRGSFTAIKFITPDGRPAFTELPEGPHLGQGVVAWSPDGRLVAAVANPGMAASRLWIVEPDGRTPYRQVLQLPMAQQTASITWSADAKTVIIGRREQTADVVLFDRRAEEP